MPKSLEKLKASTLSRSQRTPDSPLWFCELGKACSTVTGGWRDRNTKEASGLWDRLLHLNYWVNNTASGKFLDTDKVWEFRQKNSEQGHERSGKDASTRGNLSRKWKIYHFSKEKQHVFSWCLHRGRAMQRSTFLQKIFRMKGQNFNKINFCCLNINSCFPRALLTLNFFSH